MKFCSVCDMYYYIVLMKTTTIRLFITAETAGIRESSLDGHCVLTTQIQKSEQSFHHIVNKYTKLDPRSPQYK
jgi:hypothetical protein